MFGRRRDRHSVGSDARDIYEQEKISTEWRDSVIIAIYKEKGDILHSGLWKLPGDKADVTYYEDLGKDH